jgi:UDP-N-acetyl-D-mannosaminuronic acid transferase (WecB/TagA/CpsF family)
MARREALLDPTGDGDRATQVDLAPRLRSLNGLRVGLLGNAKPNAAALLSEVATELRRSYDLDSVSMYTKGYFGTPVEEDQITRILRNCDFVVAGVGD